MANLINATPLYNFLKYCNASNLERKVLDCGAGGSNPPLFLFFEHGYKVFGIELCDEQIKRTNEFCEAHDIQLNIIKGDMTALTYGDQSFSYVYSYNTSVHMTKRDFKEAICEFHRVLRPGGLCYINFLNEDCDTYGVGEEVSEGEFKVFESEEETRYSHYRQLEIEKMIHGFEVVYKERKFITRKVDGIEMHSGYYDYILKKAEHSEK